MAESVIQGTEIKLQGSVAGLGAASLRDVEFAVALVSGNGTRFKVEPSRVVATETDTFTVAVDTSGLPLGTLYMEVCVKLPDADFPDGLRTETARAATGLAIVR